MQPVTAALTMARSRRPGASATTSSAYSAVFTRRLHRRLSWLVANRLIWICRARKVPGIWELRLTRLNCESFRRFALRGVAVAVVLVITMGGLLFSQSYLKANKVFKGGAGTAAALNANPKPELLKGEGRGRVNVLLMGRGGGGQTAPDLTDT